MAKNKDKKTTEQAVENPMEPTAVAQESTQEESMVEATETETLIAKVAELEVRVAELEDLKKRGQEY